MARTLAIAMAFALTASLVMPNETLNAAETLNEKVAAYLAERAKEFDQISPERASDLQKLANFVRQNRQANQPTRLLFVCTHNSRRSQFAQVWAAAAAAYYNVPKVATYSGGTESTALNPRAVAALQHAGIEITKTTGDANPVYHAQFGHGAPVLTLFSKVLNNDPNPEADFCAVMVCSQADRSCPLVSGAAQRLSIAYDDPKLADDSPNETATYDERCRQIAREMMYAMSLLKG